MDTQIKAAKINWNDTDEDTDSDDSESSNESKSEKSDHEHEHEEKKRGGHGRRDHYGGRDGYNNHQKYQNRGYGGGRPKNNFRGDPNGNYEMYYKNDPNFFVEVIKQEEGPHELAVKISEPRGGYYDHDYQPSDLSIDDIKTILSEFGVEETDINFGRNGEIRVSITIANSED